MHFKQRLARKELLHGTMVTLSHPSIAEILSECGFDWLWVDMEHSPLSIMDIQAICQAKRKECAALVRVPTLSHEWIKRVLDTGAEGVIVPHVSTVEKALAAAQAAQLHPKGIRTATLSRACQYGLDPDANQNQLLLIQIEEIDGVENVDEIIRVPGIDAVIIGPYDLSVSLGKPGDFTTKAFKKAVEQVIKACKKARMPVGIFSMDAKIAKENLKLGFNFLSTGIDVHFLSTAALNCLKEVKK